MTALCGPLGLLAAGASAALALWNLAAAPSRGRVRAGIGAMLLMAGASGYFLWAAAALRRMWTPEFYLLRVDSPGPQTLHLRRPGRLLGYRARLVPKPGGGFPSPEAADLPEGLAWELPGKAVHAHDPRCGSSDRSVLFDEDWGDEALELRYRVTDPNRARLGGWMLEVAPSSASRRALAASIRTAQFFMMGALAALVLSGFGVSSQKRRLARAAARAPAPSTSGPPGP